MDGLIPCPCCNGSGVEVFGVIVYETGCGFSHDSSDEMPCSECDGTGEVWEDCEPAGEEWTL